MTNDASAKTAFQDGMEHNLCFGCGPHNDLGLRIKSHWEGDVSVCVFEPQAHHMAGPRHILNGGIIATVIDCHSICTAIADAYRREGREIGSEPVIWYATGSLHVDYKHPAAIDKPVELRAIIAEVKPKKTVVHCKMFSEGDVCAFGEVVCVRVPREWFAGT